MTIRLWSVLPAAACIAALAACEKPAKGPATPPAETAAASAEGAVRANVDFHAVAEAAVNDPARPEADRLKDAVRKPVEALSFMRVAPGMSIFELEAGGGWYTELLARAAGPGGRVVMQNPQGFLEFVSTDIEARLKDDRLPNVKQSISNFDVLEATDGSVDLVTWVQGPHELFFKPSDGVTLGDPDAAYSEIHRILKADGEFVVIDHSAQSGAPETTGDTLHRIDKAIVIEAAMKAGFRLVDEASFLANPADDRTKSVFDPEIRGHTDQFVLRFRKKD